MRNPSTERTVWLARRSLLGIVLLAVALLVACSGNDAGPGIPQPPPASQAFSVDSGGGSFTFGDPDNPKVTVTFVVPPNAVPDGTVLTVAVNPAFTTDPTVIDGLVFDFGPSGMSFDPPLSISLTYDPATLDGASPAHLRLHKRVGTTWREFPVIVDTVNQTVTAVLAGFSTWAVFPDATPPVTAASPPATAPFAAPFSVTLTCSDGTGSGCAATYYSRDGSDPTTASSVYSAPIDIVAETVLAYFSVDNAGNEEVVQKQHYVFATTDVTAPTNDTIAEFINDGAASTVVTSVTLALAATDDTGVTAYFAAENPTTPLAGAAGWTQLSPVTTYSATVNFVLSGGIGAKTVHVWFKDEAGNVSEPHEDSISFAPATDTPPAEYDHSRLHCRWGGDDDLPAGDPGHLGDR